MAMVYAGGAKNEPNGGGMDNEGMDGGMDGTAMDSLLSVTGTVESIDSTDSTIIIETDEGIMDTLKYTAESSMMDGQTMTDLKNLEEGETYMFDYSEAPDGNKEISTVQKDSNGAKDGAKPKSDKKHDGGYQESPEEPMEEPY
jgi:hypothetical protein